MFGSLPELVSIKTVNCKSNFIII